MKHLSTLALGAASLLSAGIFSPARAADVLLPQNRAAFYSDETVELAVTDLPKGQVARLELVPAAGATPLSFSITGDGSAVSIALPPRSLAPGDYTLKLDGKAGPALKITTGVLSSTMLTSQSINETQKAGGNFLVSNAFGFGQLTPDGLSPAADLRGHRSGGLNAYENAVAADTPSLCYMYWTGYVTHKPFGTEKSWANADMGNQMRLMSFHTAQYLRRYNRNIISVGTLDEPGLSWGKTPAGGAASGFPNRDEVAWYESRGWKYTSDTAGGSDSDWMHYMTIRCAIMKEQNAQAKRDLKTVWPGMTFSTDLYAPNAIMDGTDPLNQQVNDIPSSHVFMDWGTGKAGVIGAIYLEKAHDPTSKLAHAMNGQLFGVNVPQPQQSYAYHLMMNGMLAAGLHSNWWLNTGGMSNEELKAVNDPAKHFGPVFQNMTPRADVAVLWSFTEIAMRQKDMAARESKKKDGEQIKMMVASWPETNDAAGTGEQGISAYNIGGNYKEQILNAHQAINRAGYAAHILHERILPSGILKNYKVLVVVGQTFALPPETRAQIAAFQARGGKVITDSTTTQSIPGALKTDANLRDPAFRWGGTFSLDPKTNPKVTDKQASYYQTNFWMDKQSREASPPMKRTLAKTGATPVFDTADAWLVGERHGAGEGEMNMVLNSHEELAPIKDTDKYFIYNYAPYSAQFTLRGIPKNAAVYEVSGLDWATAKRVENPLAAQNASFQPGEMKLYLVAPRAPSGLNLKAQSAEGALHVRASLKNLKMPWPLLVTIKSPAGATLYSVYRATDATGAYSESFPIGANALAGNYQVSVSSPVEPDKVAGVASVAIGAAKVAPLAFTDAARVFDEASIRAFLASKPVISIALGDAKYNDAAQKLAAALRTKGIKASVVPEADVLQKALYPRLWNPYAKLYSDGPAAKLPDGADVKTRITITTGKDGSFSAKDEAGKEYGDDWHQPNSLITAAGDGFVDYQNKDSEDVFKPGVQFYLNKDRVFSLTKGTVETVPTTEEFKAQWRRPWHNLTTYQGVYQMPPQLPEAYDVNSHLILLGDSQNGQLVAALQASELLPEVADAKYPGAGKALVEFAWSPFAVEKNAIFIGASDKAGVEAGVARLEKLLPAK